MLVGAYSESQALGRGSADPISLDLIMSSMTLQDNTPMPYSSGIINRPRLIDRLQAASEYKLTLVSAPPGYGKTTLASQYVRQARCPVAWQTVEERDRD